MKQASVCSFATNLIANGDAEADTTATGDGFINHDVSAWENETGTFTVVRYGAPPDFPTSASPGPPNRGTFFLDGGTVATSSASQVINLSDCSSQIDGGAQQFNLSGFLGGYQNQGDSARVVVSFKDAANATLGTASIGPVMAADRANVTGLLARKSVGMVPIGTRTAEAVLTTTRIVGTRNDGYADDLSFTLAAPESCSALPSGALSWWRAEGDAGDSLGVNSGLMRNATLFSAGLVGRAFTFDGFDDHVSINRSIQDDFTIEFWLNTTQMTRNLRGQWYDGTGLVDAEVTGVTDDFGMSLLDGKVHFGTGRPDVTIRSGVVADGNWHHVAATRRRSTGELKLYVDGSEAASGVAGTQSLTAPNRILFGLLQTNINAFQGRLDEVAIYGRVLSPEEIGAIYEAGGGGKCAPSPTCASAPANQVAWWRAEGNASDSAGVHHGALQNVTFAAGSVGQGFKLSQSDGTQDQISIPDSPDLRPANFTAEAWIRFDSLNTPNASAPGLQYIIFKKNTRATNFEGYTLHKIEVAGAHRFSAGVSSAAGTFATVNSQTHIVAGQFYHVAATRDFDGTSGTLRLYVNGVLEGSAPANFPPDYDSRPVFLGSSGESHFNGYLDGVIDEAALYNRALSAAEIQAIFHARSAGKCRAGELQSLTLSPNPVDGGQPSTGTVTLSAAAPAGGALVELGSGSAAVAVPTSVTVGAGQTTASFTITTAVPAADAAALITASYQTSSASASLTVLSPKPDLKVTGVGAPPAATTDAAFNVSWTVKNEGAARADAPWADKVWLSSDNQLGAGDTLVGEYPFGRSLEPNQTADRIQTVSIARRLVGRDGPYFLLIQTDANSQINEGVGEGNNILVRPINITRQPRPDLVVDGIVAPNVAFFGQSILVQWTVRNAGGGPTNAQGWLDYVYLSQDDVPEIEDPFKIPVSAVNFLSSGESYTATAELRIPRGLVGQYKIVVWTDGDGTNHRSNDWPHAVIEDDNENNYGVARPIQINTPILPDLQTVSVAAPEEVFAGGQMTLNWRVENRGDGVTPPDQTNWQDRVYLSQDTSLDVNADRLIGSRPRSGALAQTEGYTVSNFNTPLPNDIAGDWYVFVLADGDNRVYEFNNENNNAARDTQQPGSPVRVRATPPDLMIPNPLTAPPAASAGQSLAVSWTVKNQGAFESAPNWFDAVYLSADQTLDAESDTLLTSVFRSGPLGPELTYDATANVAVPPCLSGTHYIFVLADSRRQVFEFDPNFNAEANNASQPRPIQITDATPDLSVSAVIHPAAGNAGQPVSVNWTVTNQGAGATAPTTWTDRVYLTPTQTFDSATALLVGSFVRAGALGAGESYARTESITVPNAAQGGYFVSVLTDANNVVEECAGNANNRGFGQQSVSISNSLPDLAVQSAGAQSTAFGGQTVGVSWTVTNQGSAAVSNSSWGDAVYFSSDAALGNDDARLATAQAAGPLPVGGNYSRQSQVALPVVTPGNYFLIIRADYLGNVFEGQQEGDNLHAVPLTIQAPAIDLILDAVEAPQSASSGQEMTLSWTVRNGGVDPTIGSHWVDEVVLSLDQIDDPSDRVIGSKRRDGVLGGQAVYNDSLSVLVPQGLTGQYYVFVRTDRRNEVAESSENNNSAADGITLNLTPPADLTVSSVSPPAGASPGEPINVNWTVTNGGANPATGSWQDAVYLSLDQAWDIGDLLIGKQTRGGPVAAGQSYGSQLNTILPALTPGSYYVVVKADTQNRVRETSDDNNTGAADAPTPVEVTALQIGVPLSTTLTTGQERFYRTDAPADETVRFALEGQVRSANELFARFGQIASRNSFEFSFSRSNEANQEVLVPNSRAGSYFALARSEFSTPSPQSVTIKADVIPFGITSVSPNRVGDNGQVTITLRGARFEEGAVVRLTGNGTTLSAAKVIRVDPSTVKARFVFINAPRGIYDVTLTNPGGPTSTLGGALTIEQARLAQPLISKPNSLTIRPMSPLNFYGEVRNPGNVDIQYVSVKTDIVVMESDDRVVIVTQRPGASLPRKTDFPWVDWGSDPLTNVRYKNYTSDTFVQRDLAPSEAFTFDTEVRGLNRGTPYLRVDATGQTLEEAMESLVETAEFQRQQHIKNNTELPPDFAAALSNSQTWADLISSIAVALGYYDGVFGQLEENPRRTLKNAILIQSAAAAFNQLVTSVAEPACNALFESSVTGCSATCGVQGGCCGFGVAASLASGILTGTVKSPGPAGRLSAALDIITGGWNLGVCARKAFDCLSECPDNPFSLVNIKRALDPNEKLSPDGYGEQRFVAVGQEIAYTINFENLPAATAYAQRIRITDQLDPNLDPRTVRLREIGFKQYRFQVPENRAFFQRRVQLGPDLGNLLADISAGVDLATGTVTWTLTAIDPATGEQSNSANLGLLPPNNARNDGQGFVTFTVKPKATAATGTVVRNGATIIFDTEAPIDTNVVSNMIDAEAPASAVDSLPATQPGTTFNISWSGADAQTGSGLLSYDVFVSANNGPYQQLLSGTATTSTQFTAEQDTTYRFYSIARDNAGNVEAPPESPDAVTSVGAPPTAPPVASAATNVTAGSFTAGWGASAGATGYRLDVSTDGSFGSYVSGHQDLDVGNVLSRSVTGLSGGTPFHYRVRAYNAGGASGNSNTVSVTTTSCAPRIDDVAPKAGRAAGGQKINLTGDFACLSGVSIGGATVSWSYVGGTGGITFTSPAHPVGAVDIVLTITSGDTQIKSNAFAYLPTAFTDDQLMAGVTTAKALHIIELRQAADALRAVAGLAPAQWTDPALPPAAAFIKAVHVTELRARVEEAAAALGFAPAAYADPNLGARGVLKRLHIEELRQRIRSMAEEAQASRAVFGRTDQRTKVKRPAASRAPAQKEVRRKQ